MYIIEWMIEKEYILRTKHPKYPVLYLTYKGMHYDQEITESSLRSLEKKLRKSNIIGYEEKIKKSTRDICER